MKIYILRSNQAVPKKTLATLDTHFAQPHSRLGLPRDVDVSF